MRLYTMLRVSHLRMSPCITTEKCGRNCTVKNCSVHPVKEEEEEEEEESLPLKREIRSC